MSTFYDAKFTRRFPVPYLLVDRLVALLENQDKNESAIMNCVIAALKECGIRDKPSPEDIAYVIERLAPKPAAADEGAQEDKDLEGKAFAGGYIKWVKALSPEQTCMYVTGYDFEQARHLYCEVDRDDVQALAELRVNHDWETVKIRFEAVLFGFGGGYGKSSEPDKDATEDDLKKLNAMMGL